MLISTLLFFSQLLHHGWAQTPIHRILTPWLCRVQYNRYFPQLSTWAVPSQYWSQPYSPPFSKGGFLLVEMYCTIVETSSTLTYFWEGIKVTPPRPQAHSSGVTPPWVLCSLLHAARISDAWNFGLQILAFKSNIFLFAECKESSSNTLRLTLLNAYYHPLILLHNGKA